jgi:hypothetical protein
VPAIALLTRAIAVAAGLVFAAFLAAKGIPTLRHDWAWPVDRAAIPSFVGASLQGWLSDGLGAPNPHPTTYLIALPLGAAMWLFGPLGALVLFAAVVGYLCMSTVTAAATHWRAGRMAAAGLGLFALFNPWVYNEVVAGHLVMVLAYGGLIGLFAEMLRGRNASPVRLGLWIALVEAQLQFFLLGMLALVVFAFAARMWLPVIAGAFAGLPSLVGLVADRATLLRTPYGLEWQTNQSIQPEAFVGLGGYFAGYSDALGVAGAAAAWIVLALAVAGAVAARRTKAARFAIAAAALISAIVLGVHGPLAAPYAWAVRNVPESGVFRELYDLAGVTAGLVIVLACAAAARVKAFAYVALAAGAVAPVTWLLHPPSDFWIGSSAYPHPVVATPPYTRVALMPAFQPMGLRGDGGDGADPDAYVHPPAIPVINEYLPSYPVDMALAQYEQSGSIEALRAFGVTSVVARPWLVSRMGGAIGLAATALAPHAPHVALASRQLGEAMPLLSECAPYRIARFPNSIGACDVFLGDAPGFTRIRPVNAPSDSIDPQAAWIDARLAFAQSPALAQGIGGALTLSSLPLPVEPSSWLLAYLHGGLNAPDGRSLAQRRGSFVWLYVPAAVASVRCDGLCELVAQTSHLPDLQPSDAEAARALEFRRFAPWLYRVNIVNNEGDPAALLRFNERYDGAWIAYSGWHALPHVRIDSAVNGWILGPLAGGVVLVQVTAVAQMIAEIIGAICVIWLLKALSQAPTKRAS